MSCLLALLAAIGCGPKDDPGPSPDRGAAEDEPPVRILVLDDPPLAQVIERTWRERGDGAIEVAHKSAQEVLDSPRRVLDADLVVYPAELLGELAERELISPLDAETRQDANLSLADYFPYVRLQVMSWDRKVTAAALGAPQLMLLYRRDVLAKAGAKPPQTWEQYHELAAELNDPQPLEDLAGEPWAGACEPGGDWLPTMLMSRAACYLGQSHEVSPLWDFRPMKAQLDRPALQRALKQMADSEGIDRSATSPQQCLQALLEGHCAMAICWPSNAAARQAPSDSDQQAADSEAGQQASDDNIAARLAALPLGCAPLPGAGEVYQGDQWKSLPAQQPQRVPVVGAAGRLVSVTREALRRDSAAQRLVWLTGKEWSDVVGPASAWTMPCRVSSSRLGVWSGDVLDDEGLSQLADVLKPMSQRQPTMTTVRIPGRQRYLDALGEAVEQAIEGKPVEQALRDASDRWDAVTQQLGVDKQREALARSLDL